MTSPRVKLNLPPPADPYNRKVFEELKSMMEGLTPDERHAAIIDAVPELRRLPGNVRLIRDKARK